MLSVVQIIENWSRIVGRVEAWDPPAREGESGTLALRVEQVSEITQPSGSTYPNLLGGCEGRVLRVHVPATAAGSLDTAVNARVVLDVRRGRAPDVVFARPAALPRSRQHSGRRQRLMSDQRNRQR